MPIISSTLTDILVTGAGPAGCTVAVGLRRLGYRVTLVHAPRPWPSCEGISTRTLQGLESAGLQLAAASALRPSPRRVEWNGESSAANTEHLVLRQTFDAALLEDAGAAGVKLVAGRVRNIDYTHAEGPLVTVDSGADTMQRFSCRFLVEARGRAAPGTGAGQLRGPESVCLLQLRQGPPGDPGTLVSSFPEGWAWLAHTAEGLSFVQLSVCADASSLPGRGELNGWFDRQLRQVPAMREWLQRSEPAADVIARGSTSILQGELVTPNGLRVGDAAMAVDPLSGNGIFQSLSCALVAPAVINTLLQNPANRDLATDFYGDRVRHTFLRFARMGRDFYRMESRWRDGDFWRRRQDWPDAEAAHSEIAPTLLGIESRPVVSGDMIRSQSVAVTSDQPLGVWHVGGVELAPLLQDLPAAPDLRRPLLSARLEDTCGRDATAKAMLQAWLRRYDLL